ncbi:unnamed protein product, partial [Nippostrongylus brasiliensis]|uniref:EGF-like domain-containing protein n=1 Tax=Nippostrongylus brasiliensis TaxID=27835 RepID=A0A0N4XLA0_NIPBR
MGRRSGRWRSCGRYEDAVDGEIARDDVGWEEKSKVMGDILFSVDRSFCKDRCLESGVCYKTTADYVCFCYDESVSENCATVPQVEVEASSGSCAMWRFFAGWMLLGLVVAFFEILWIIWIMRRRRAAARRAIVDGEVAVAQAEAVVEEMDVEEQPVVEDVVVAERRPTMELPVFRILDSYTKLIEEVNDYDERVERTLLRCREVNHAVEYALKEYYRLTREMERMRHDLED